MGSQPWGFGFEPSCEHVAVAFVAVAEAEQLVAVVAEEPAVGPAAELVAAASTAAAASSSSASVA